MAKVTRGGAGCLIPIGLLFAVLGFIPGWFALADLRQGRATAHWIPTTAEILHLELAHGDSDSGTVSIDCRYRWRAPARDAVEGGGSGLTAYEGAQVGLHEGADNVGDWQMETFARLDAARRAEQPVPCWYDPADPAQAILDRGVRWELVGFMLLFPLIFGLVGGGIAIAGVMQLRRRAAPAAPQTQPEGGLLRGRTGGAGNGLVFFAVFWNLVSWGIAIGLLLSAPRLEAEHLLVALFPLIGVFLGWAAALVLLRRLRHGVQQLRCEAGDWVAGGRVRATLLTRTAPQPGDTLLFTLAHLRRQQDSENATAWTPVWSHQFTADPSAGRPDPLGWAQPVEVPLPVDLDPVDDGHAWRLEYRLVRPGLDLLAVFDLPVRAGPGPGAEPELTAVAITAAADRAAPLAVLQHAGITVAEEGRGLLVTVPAWRNPSLHLSGIGFAGFYTVLAAVLWIFIGWWTGLFTVPLFALVWRGALRSCFWRAHMRIAGGRITVVCGWFTLQTFDLAATEVVRVDNTTNMKSGQTAWHNLSLVTGDGRSVPFARGVPGPAAARLVELVEAARAL